MKKIFGICMGLGALLLGSCSSEEPVLSTENGGNVVFTATLPASMAQTRGAYDDGQTATRLDYAVYDADGTNIATLDGEETFTNLQTTVSLSLVTGKTYTVVFWASAPVEEGEEETAPYAFDKSTGKVTVNTNGNANDKNRDAFFAYEKFTVTGAISKTVELKRPFAQINIGTSDLEAFKAAGGTISKSGITVTAPNVLDLRDGSVEGEEEYVLAPAEFLPDTEVFPVTTTPTQKWLSTVYVLTDATKTTLDVTWTSDNTNNPAVPFTYVPVQRNYRTNIYGALLTNPANYNVVINPQPEEPAYNIGIEASEPKINNEGEYLIYTQGELAWIAEQVKKGDMCGNKTFSLQNDIYMVGTWTPIGGGGLGFNSRFCGKFLGNGYTIYNMKIDVAERAGFFGFLNGTVEDLNFDNASVSSNHWAGVVVGYSDNETGSTYIKNCKVSNSTVTLAAEIVDGDWDNGDKGGAIIGFMAAKDQVTGCTVENVTIQGYRDLGGIIGYASGSVITGNTVNGLSIIVDNIHNYKNYTNLGTGGNDANGVIGEKTSTATDDQNTATNVSISELVADGVTFANDVYTITKGAGLVWMSEQVNKPAGEGRNNFSGMVVKLGNDIDMAGIAYVPCGDINGYHGKTFAGTFDGQNFTISNLTTSAADGENSVAALFGSVWKATIKNVTLKNVNITSQAYAAAIVGYSSHNTDYSTIENCHVDGGTIISTAFDKGSSWDGGNNVGGVVGYAVTGDVVSGCTAKNLKIKGYRAVGGIIGTANGCTVKNCSVADTEITIDNSHNYKNFTEQSQYTVNEVIGRDIKGITEGNTHKNVTINGI